jgi:hypothetical protein
MRRTRGGDHRTFAHPQYLVDTDWLEAHLSDPDLRVLDCTVLFQTDADGVRVNNGREAWAQGHIPGSGFADLMQDLSDSDSQLPFMTIGRQTMWAGTEMISLSPPPRPPVPGWGRHAPPAPGRRDIADG